MHSLVFFLILEIISSEKFFEFLSLNIEKRPFLALLLFIIFLSFVFTGASRFGKSWKMTPIPILFASTAVGLIFFVDSIEKRQMFSIMISIFYYFGQIGIYRLSSCKTDQTARAVIAGVSVASIFLFYSFFYAIYLNFTFPIWAMMIVFFIVTTMISFQYMQLVKKNNKEAWKLSLIMGLVMMEISWTAHFWPFGYLTTGATMLIFYYVFWDLVQSYFLDKLSKRRVIANIVFFGILAGVVITSSRWLPVV